MRLRTFIPIVALALITSGCSGGDASTTTPEEETTTTAEAVAPDTVGMGLSDARIILEDAGYTVNATDSFATRTILMESNWIVLSQEADGTKVNLGAQKTTDGQEATPSEPAEPAAPAAPTVPAAPIETASGLTPGMAQVACEHYAEAQYPYGFNPHWLLDGNYNIVGDTVFLQAGVEITNAFDAEYDATVECTVSGTEGATAIDSFLIY